MRERIEKSKLEIPENYHVTFDYYLEQITLCEDWNRDTEKHMEDKGS